MRAYLIRESSNELAPTSLQVNQSLKTSKGKAPSNKFPYLCQPIILAASRVPSLDDKSQVDTVDDEKTQIILHTHKILTRCFTVGAVPKTHEWLLGIHCLERVRDSLPFVTLLDIISILVYLYYANLGGGGLWGLRGSGFSDHLIGPNFVHRNN